MDADLDALVADWLSIPEVAERLGVEQRAVRSLIRERRLAALPRASGRGPSVPEAFLVPARDAVGADDGSGADHPRHRVLTSLRGSLIQLADAGYDDAEAVRWLFTPEELLGERPVDALRAGRASAVRRAAQPLAF